MYEQRIPYTHMDMTRRSAVFKRTGWNYVRTAFTTSCKAEIEWVAKQASQSGKWSNGRVNVIFISEKGPFTKFSLILYHLKACRHSKLPTRRKEFHLNLRNRLFNFIFSIRNKNTFRTNINLFHLNKSRF